MDLKDEIKRLVPLSSLIGTLDKKIKCPNPSHRDNHPSCSVDHNKGLWNCFVCDIGGDVIEYLMIRDRKDFKTALQELAEMAGVPLAKDNSEEARQHWEREQRIQKARRFAVDYYHNQLLGTPGGLNYLENRGISLETIKKMRIGWSTGKLHKVIAETMPDGLTLQDFIDAGLVKQGQLKGENAYFDWFDTRIIFPLISRGKIHNISGRVTDFSVNQKQKYKHLHGVTIEHFYNEDALSDSIWLFEGHSDALVGVEVGLPAIGVIGTSGMVCPEKLANCKEIFVCPDNDAAGKSAASKWAEAIIKHNSFVKLYFVLLPDGIKDFNEWVCKHRGSDLQYAFQQLIAGKKELIAYEISQLESTDSLNKIWPLLEPLPDVVRDKYFKAIKERLPGCGIDSIRKTYKNWKTEKENSLLTRNSKVVELCFDEDEVKHINIDYKTDGCAVGQVCVWAKTKRINEAGDEERRLEPILIRSTLDPGKDGWTAEAIPLADSGIPFLSKMVPLKSVTRGRWSDAAIQRFLSGKTAIPNTARLLERISDIFRKYIWYKNVGNYYIMASFAMGTYLARLFGMYPYLVFNGLRGTGKTNALELFEDICFNAVMSASSTVSYTFRIIESSFTTWIRDEAEYFNRITPDKEEEASILNAGYKAGGVTGRISKGPNGEMIPEEFDVFSPKIFAGIKVLNPTLMSRGILIQSDRAPEEITKQIPDMAQNRRNIKTECAEIRDELYVWSLTQFPRAMEIFESYPKVDGIHNREREIWLPLLTIALMADEDNQTEDPANSYSSRMIALAKSKAEEKKHAASNESREARVLEVLLFLLADVTADGLTEHHSNPEFYPLQVVAKRITQHFHEDGYLKTEWSITSRELTRILQQTGVIENRIEDMKQLWMQQKNVWHVRLRKSQIEEALARL